MERHQPSIMSEKRFGTVISPYFEGENSLADVLTACSYVDEKKCRYGHTLTIRKSFISKFKEDVCKAATAVYIVDEASDEFEAHFEEDGQFLAVIVTQAHTYFNCTMFSNVGMEHLFEFIGKHREAFSSKHVNEIEVNYFYSSSRGFDSNTLYVNRDQLGPIYPELYPDIDIKKLLEAYGRSRESILMLYGTPGVGKTTFIKFLLAAGHFQSVAYVKDPEVMSKGDLWGRLTTNNYNLVIFDDLDKGLAPRGQGGDDNFMTQLLSFSDGIFHSSNSKIIITTNQHVPEIDAALVRPGRCFDFLELHALERAQAKAAWTELLGLSEEQFEIAFDDNQEVITQASLMSQAAMSKSSYSRNYIKSGNTTYSLDQKLQDLNIKVTQGRKTKAGF